VPCYNGVVTMEIATAGSQISIPEAVRVNPEMVTGNPAGFLSAVQAEVARRGGVLPKPSGTDHC
jgi:hypothetical protein